MAEDRPIQRDTQVGVRLPRRYPGRVRQDTATPPPAPRLPQPRPFEAGDRTLNAGDPISVGERNVRPSSRAAVKAVLSARDFATLQDNELEDAHFAHNRRLALGDRTPARRSARSRR